MHTITKEKTWYHREHSLYRDHSLEGFVQVLSAERSNYLSVIDVPRPSCTLAHPQLDVILETLIFICRRVNSTHFYSISLGDRCLVSQHRPYSTHPRTLHTNLFHQTICS